MTKLSFKEFIRRPNPFYFQDSDGETTSQEVGVEEIAVKDGGRKILALYNKLCSKNMPIIVRDDPNNQVYGIVDLTSIPYILIRVTYRHLYDAIKLEESLA